LSSTASVSIAHGLVVGADGSESSSLALEFAATEARVRSLPLEVVNTWKCLTRYGGTYPDIDIAGHAKREVDETVKSVLGEGPRCRSLRPPSRGTPLWCRSTDPTTRRRSSSGARSRTSIPMPRGPLRRPKPLVSKATSGKCTTSSTSTRTRNRSVAPLSSKSCSGFTDEASCNGTERWSERREVKA
jgi:hypothetical protein